MIIVGETIVSEDLLEVCFSCDLKKCLGNCCVEGDAGAPLTEEETEILQAIYPSVRPYLSHQNIQAIAQQGVYVKDFEGDLTTPLVGDKQCVYVYYDEDNIARCTIEKAYFNGYINFRKPISCHLYPIRISKNNGFDAVNYHKWPICDPARKHGKKLNIPVYKFTKDALIRKYGEKWYEEFESIARGSFRGEL